MSTSLIIRGSRATSGCEVDSQGPVAPLLRSTVWLSRNTLHSACRTRSSSSKLLSSCSVSLLARKVDICGASHRPVRLPSISSLQCLISSCSVSSGYPICPVVSHTSISCSSISLVSANTRLSCPTSSRTFPPLLSSARPMYLGSAVTHSSPFRSGCASRRYWHAALLLLSSQHVSHLPHLCPAFARAKSSSKRFL